MGIKREMGIMIWIFGGKSGLWRYCGNRVGGGSVVCVRSLLYHSDYILSMEIFSISHMFFRLCS